MVDQRDTMISVLDFRGRLIKRLALPLGDGNFARACAVRRAVAATRVQSQIRRRQVQQRLRAKSTVFSRSSMTAKRRVTVVVLVPRTAAAREALPARRTARSQRRSSQSCIPRR